MDSNTSFNINYSSDEEDIIIITNLLKMLENRNLITKLSANNKTLIETINRSFHKYMYYNITLDSPDKNGNKIYKLIYVNDEIDKIVKNTNVFNFITKYPNEYKIILTDNITKKTMLQSIQYKNVEVFKKRMFLLNLVDHILVPIHQLLSEQEKIQIRDEYNVEFTKYPKIYITDPISKYYNAKIGDVFRIIRPSNTAGTSVFYRVVVMG